MTAGLFIMKVDKELIEKYHQNLCSEQERRLVEDWLFNDEAEEVLSLPIAEHQIHKDEIWAGISRDIPALAEPKVFKLSDYFSPFIKTAVAASLIIGVLSSLTLWWMHNNVWDQPVNVANTGKFQNEKVQTSGLNIVLAPQSRANISSSAYHQSGNIDFCGTILINPKEDFELTLKANCADPNRGTEKIKLKKGQNYYAVNYRFNASNELIIVNEENLINLPPVLQRELIEKFKI